MIEIRDMSKQFGSTTIFHNCNLTFEKHSLIGCIGPNGVGKTTFLSLLSGIFKATTGEMRVFDQTINSTADAVGKVSFFLDEKVLSQELTGKQHLEALPNLNPELVKEYVAYFSFSDALKKKVKKYSLGMRQLLLLIMTLSLDTDILLLDEVLNGLDPKNRKLTIRLLNKLKGNKLIFFSSHQLIDVTELSDKILIFTHQKIVEYSKEEISIEYLEQHVFNIGEAI